MVVFNCVNLYYKYLIESPDLTRVAGLTAAELQKMREKDFKAHIAGAGAEGVAAVCEAEPPPAVEEGEVPVEDPDEVMPMPVVPHIPVDAPAIPPPLAAPHLLMPHLPEAPAPVVFGIGGYPSMTIHFDNYTHQSGNRRALMYCQTDGHKPKCRRYIFLHSYPTTEHACAWLFAWGVGGAVKDDASSHIEYDPDKDLVDAMYALRFN